MMLLSFYSNGYYQVYIHELTVTLKPQTVSVIISLDSEKAFDSVHWEYLYLTLKRFDFNDQITECLRSLYYSPSTRIKINRNLPHTVRVESGCRQGCPQT